MFDQADRRSIADRRIDASREAIVDAAWDLCRQEGLTGWSLRQLAKGVGLTAPTLYAYFDSKHAIYDAMFKQGYEQFAQLGQSWKRRPNEGARAAFKRGAAEFFEFCTSDPTRYQLMFQRVVPDFEPSAEAYAASLATYAQFRAEFASLGITDEADLDLWTAIATGLTDQQISNDPGGDRWQRLLEPAVDLFCNHVGLPPDVDSET